MWGHLNYKLRNFCFILHIVLCYFQQKKMVILKFYVYKLLNGLFDAGAKHYKVEVCRSQAEGWKQQTIIFQWTRYGTIFFFLAFNLIWVVDYVTSSFSFLFAIVSCFVCCTVNSVLHRKALSIHIILIELLLETLVPCTTIVPNALIL